MPTPSTVIAKYFVWLLNVQQILEEQHNVTVDELEEMPSFDGMFTSGLTPEQAAETIFEGIQDNWTPPDDESDKPEPDRVNAYTANLKEYEMPEGAQE